MLRRTQIQRPSPRKESKSRSPTEPGEKEITQKRREAEQAPWRTRWPRGRGAGKASARKSQTFLNGKTKSPGGLFQFRRKTRGAEKGNKKTSTREKPERGVNFHHLQLPKKKREKLRRSSSSSQEKQERRKEMKIDCRKKK